MESTTKNNPVWSLYDETRTARLNVKCLQGEIAELRCVHNWVETVIAVSSISSISGFWFLQNIVGGLIWKTVGAVAVLCIAVKPVFRISERMRKKQELLTSYKILDHDLHCIGIDVKEHGRYGPSQQTEFHKALKRKADLIKQADDSSVSDALRTKCEAQVENELPLDSFYIPKE